VKLDSVIGYALGKPCAEETYPFGEGELVCKVGDKAFAFIGLESHNVGVKCGANEAEAKWLRDRYPDAVTVAAWIGRYGWNTVALDGTVPAAETKQLIDQSYETVVAKLPRSRRP
jgi:predicted DNA-binding protein (MmcQ/YjbR family)